MVLKKVYIHKMYNFSIYTKCINLKYIHPTRGGAGALLRQRVLLRRGAVHIWVVFGLGFCTENSGFYSKIL